MSVNSRLVAFFILTLTAALGAQQPMKSAWLEWANMRIAIAPDSGGTYLWLVSTRSPEPKRSGPQTAPTKFFQATFDPAQTIGWIADARTFLKQPLTVADSGTTRGSMVLLTSGARLYLARRQLNGKWSPERIIVMQTEDSTEPVMVNGNEESVGDILDSLEAVARRTPLDEAVVRRDSIDRANEPRPLKQASASPRNRPPIYPQRERSLNEEGTVLIEFAIGIDGRADMKSLKVIHSPGPGFLKSVLDAMPAYTFTPATHNGVPVRSRVVMPFSFSLFR